MKLYLTKTPLFIQSLYRNYSWRFASEEKEIYLTFDDGPTTEVTQWVIDLLKKHNAKATFFCIGKNIQNHPELFSQLIAEGHAIGNHTYNHVKSWKSTTTEYLSNTQQTATIIPRQQSKLFRPPYGTIKSAHAKALRKQGFKIIMWDVLSADFDTNISKEKCLNNVLKNTRNGSVIVFHDSLKAKEKLYYALPKILDHYTKKGFVFKKIE